jgi:hypothetical protein
MQCSHKDNNDTPERRLSPISISLSYQTPTFLNFDEGESTDLFLAPSVATNLVVSVSGCKSGYTLSSFTITSGVVRLYKDDETCLIKLTGFTLGSTTYSSTGGTDFTTWLNNDVAIFKDTGSSSTIKVFVNSQVTQAGVQTADTVVYNFTDTPLCQDTCRVLPKYS